MLNELIILANDFDQKGLRKEANSVDFLIQKFAGNENLLNALLEALLFGKQPKELTEELTKEQADEVLETLSTPEAKETLEKLWKDRTNTEEPTWSDLFSGNDPRRTGRDDSITASLVGGLVKLANHLDQKGLRKEADLLDRIIRENF